LKAIRLRRDWPDARARKFRQAAFFYLHVALLYEAAVYALWRNGTFHEPRGPVELWLVMGAAIALVVFWALWSWQNEWIARVVWALNALRLPTLITGAFLRAHGGLPSSFYLVALIVIVLNLWLLARAGWDV
jgi:hypothetical protein